MRKPLPIFLEGMLGNSIEFNGAFYPANSVAKAVVHVVTPLFFGNPEFPDFPLSFFGSGFKVQQNQRFAVFSTAHQHKTHSANWAILETSSPHQWTSGHRVIDPVECGDETSKLDLRMLEYTLPVQSGKLASTGWFDLKENYSFEEILGCLALGYPTEKSSIYDDPNKIHTRCVAIDGDFLGATFNELNGFVPIPSLDYDPDGLSGGPVFYIARTATGHSLVPAGIVSNASRTQINFVPAEKLQSFWDC